MKKIITGIKKAIKNIWAWIKMVMKKIWSLIKIIAKWIWIFIKKVWFATIGIALWFSACFIIYKQIKLQISDRIDAWAIVTLVFVTFFYAIQTQKLVQREKISLEGRKKKRYADYGEKALQEFFMPMAVKIITFIELIKRIQSIKKIEKDDIYEHLVEVGENISELINDIVKLLEKHGYLFREDSHHFVKDLKSPMEKYIKGIKEEEFKEWKLELILILTKYLKKLRVPAQFHLKRFNEFYNIYGKKDLDIFKKAREDEIETKEK